MAGLANRVRQLRQERSWSQAELAQRAGVSRSAVAAIEGQRLVPSVAAALALAAALDGSVESVFGDASEDGATSWAWSPAALPCRFWHARVGTRVLCYPVEPTAAALSEHDGVFADGTFQPRSAIDPQQTLVMAGCDPAAGLLVSQLAHSAGVRLLVFLRSSSESLALLGQGLIHVAGIHLATAHSPQHNAQAVRDRLGGGFHLLRLAQWQEGLALAPDLKIRSVTAALRARLRWVGREPGSGARLCLDELLGERRPPRRLARNHRGVANAIRSGWADAGVCLRLTSEEAGLHFLPVREEPFDLCFPAAWAADPRLLALQQVVRSPTYRRLLGDLPGYDSSATGVAQDV